MIPDTSAGRGSTYILKSTPKCLNRLRTGQQKVTGTSSMNRSFVQSWAHLGHNMVFSTWRCSSINKSRNPAIEINKSPKHIISDSLYINGSKYYATTGRQPIVDKLAKKGFFSPKTPVKADQTSTFFFYSNYFFYSSFISFILLFLFFFLLLFFYLFLK